MINIRLEVKKLDNEDVITTSGMEFNTIHKHEVGWAAYNTDYNASGFSQVFVSYRTDRGVESNGATQADYSRYSQEASNINELGVYHYIDGNWVKCNHSYDHKFFHYS